MVRALFLLNQAPGISWRKVIENLDHDGFDIPDMESFLFFMRLYKTACKVCSHTVLFHSSKYVYFITLFPLPALFEGVKILAGTISS